MTALFATDKREDKDPAEKTGSLLMYAGGVMWESNGPCLWTATEAQLDYTISREHENADRWTGHISRDGVKVSGEFSCPSMQSLAEHLLGAARRRALRVVDE